MGVGENTNFCGSKTDCSHRKKLSVKKRSQEPQKQHKRTTKTTTGSTEWSIAKTLPVHILCHWQINILVRMGKILKQDCFGFFAQRLKKRLTEYLARLDCKCNMLWQAGWSWCWQNAMRATVEHYPEASEVPKLKVLICKGVEDLIVKVSSCSCSASL